MTWKITETDRSHYSYSGEGYVNCDYCNQVIEEDDLVVIEVYSNPEYTYKVRERYHDACYEKLE